MSALGFVSLPVLLLSLCFIFLHGRRAKLDGALDACEGRLRGLLLHRLALGDFFLELPDRKGPAPGLAELAALVLEQDGLLAGLPEGDLAELSEVSEELEDAARMYFLAKERLGRHEAGFLGKCLAAALGLRRTTRIF